jgi:BirA family biotin operon repressor/biotin-[acetyl-CoA-carboxylase] ligase
VTKLFDPQRFRSLYAARNPGLGDPLTFTPVTGSTNDDAFEAAAAGARDGSVFVSDAQRSGRGRRGNTWLSVPGEGLLFSVLLRRNTEPRDTTLLPLVVGLSVREAVAAELSTRKLSVEIQVKWPNDVLAGTRKLAGVLVEGRVRGDQAVTVAGVGLNVGRLDLPDDVASRATSLAHLGVRDVDRESLLCAILAGIAERLNGLTDTLGGERRAIAEFRRFDALFGRNIRVGDLSGVGAGIDGEGCLLINQGAGSIASVRSGHVECE